MKIIITIVVVAGIIGGVLLFVNRAESPVSTVPAVVDETSFAPETSGESEAEVKEFVVSGDNFTFSPSSIRVNKGDTVRIVFQSQVGMHDLVIDEFDVRTAFLQAGKSETIEFTVDKSGTFEYYCSVGTHRQMGMVGTLIVE